MNEANAVVASLMQQVRTVLAHPNSSSISTYEVISRVLLFLTPQSSEASDVSQSVSEQEIIFRTKYFASFASMLTTYYCSNWLEPDTNSHVLDKLFTETFIHGPAEESFIVLCHAVSAQKDGSTFKLYRFATLLTITLKDNECIFKMLESRSINPAEHIACSSNSKDVKISIWQSILSTIVSLPDVITPKLGSSSLSDFFYPKSYIPFLCTQISKFLYLVYDNMRAGRDCSVLFVSTLIGKLSAIGYAEPMWSCLLKEFVASCTNDFLLQRILQRVMNNIPSQWIEQTIVPLIASAPSALILNAFLGSISVKNAKISYILTHKLLLVRCYSDAHILQNIIGYLNSCDAVKPLFVIAFRSMLQAWGNGSSLRHRPQEQTLYICKAIMISLGYLKVDQELANQVMDVMRQSMLNGLVHYLDSPDIQIRQMGCIVAEQLSVFVRFGGETSQLLNFELVPNQLTQSLLDLMKIPDFNKDKDNIISQVNCSMSKLNTLNLESISRELSKAPDCIQFVENKTDHLKDNIKLLKKTENSTCRASLDSDDDEDYLKPFPSTLNQPGMVHAKCPLYLSQCMEGLLHTEDVDLVEQCLIHSESLIQSRPEFVEMAVDFARILLHLEDRFGLPNFALLRRRTLIAVVISSPVTVSEYLAGEFYAPNYNVSQRMDILDALSTAAHRLSLPTTSASSTLR